MEILNANEADEDEDRFCVIAAGQLTDLLNTTEIKNTNYNSVKALVQGEVNTFLGFNFIRSQRLGTDGDGNRQVIMYNRSGIALAIAQDVTVDVGPRRDKSLAKQVYLSLGIGASRMEEDKVVEIACTE